MLLHLHVSARIKVSSGCTGLCEEKVCNCVLYNLAQAEDSLTRTETCSCNCVFLMYECSFKIVHSLQFV
jgi:hypothetical protein